MGPIPDLGDLTESTQQSFSEFQCQTSQMTSCTLLCKELFDHFTSLEQNLQKKSEALKSKIQTLDSQTKAFLASLKKREVIIDDCASLLLILKIYCLKMDVRGFWAFVVGKKKEMEVLRREVSAALVECVDSAKFVLEAISEVFPVDKRRKEEKVKNDLGWACVLVLESLIPLVMDPMIRKSRLMVTQALRRSRGDRGDVKEGLHCSFRNWCLETINKGEMHLQHIVC